MVTDYLLYNQSTREFPKNVKGRIYPEVENTTSSATCRIPLRNDMRSYYWNSCHRTLKIRLLDHVRKLEGKKNMKKDGEEWILSPYSITGPFLFY